MKNTPDHPLTPEERELAQLMRRQGPHGEPSPALDARILSAAHAAVANPSARKPKPRWPVAIGLAASVVFAVGIAWQLRPVQQGATVSDAPVAYSRTQPPPSANPDPEATLVRTEEAATEAAVAAPGEASAATAMPESTITPTSEPQPAAAASQAGPPGARARVSPPEGAPMPPGPREDRYSARAAAAPPPPPAPAAPMSSDAATEAAPAFVPDSYVDASARQEAAAQGAMRSSNAATAKQAAPRDEARAAGARDMDRGVLDRVETTGSRLNRTDLQVPVSEDAQLAVEEWLERVRTRYGLGDAGAARQSLLLFVKDHPEEPVPDDLEPLLDE